MVDSKKVFQKVFDGYTEGDIVSFVDDPSKKVKVIRIFEEGMFENLVLVELIEGGYRDFIGRKLLRP